MDRELDRIAKNILRELHISGASLGIVALSDREMASLKGRFLNERAEPNVLAFPEPRRFPHPETKGRVLGEVYVNRDILERSPERTAPLLVHGILHLLGHDHKRNADAERMERLEKRVLKKLR